jgi:integrase
VTKRDAGGTEVERDRTLTVEEIKALAGPGRSSSLSERSQSALWIILSTGCRVGELMNARWSEINLDASTWFLPDTKNGRPHTIHLSEFAKRHIEQVLTKRALDDQGRPCEWVMPNGDGTGPVDVKSFGKQLADRQRPPDSRLKRRSKSTSGLALPGGRWTAHDLRRTAATLMAKEGVSGDVIDECLNHVIESRVRRIYIRDRRPEEQAMAFDALGTMLTRICAQEDSK